MRILHVTDASSAGVLTSVATLARAQSASELFGPVTFAYVCRDDTPRPQDIQRLLGPRVILRQWSSSTGVARLPALSYQLVRSLLSEHYDVIHCHSSRAGFIGRMAAKLTGNGDQIVYSPHCFAFARNDLSTLQKALYLMLERAATRMSAKVVVVSDSEAAIARKALPHAHISVLPNAVDNASLAGFLHRQMAAANNTPTGGSPRTRRVIHIGRIAEQKAPSLFSAAVQAIDNDFTSNHHGELEVMWLGDGKRFLLHDYRGRIRVSGWLTPERLREEIARADVLLFTSRGEGMPLALLEAQGLGVPIVASKVAGVTDVVRHGETGYLASSAEELGRYVTGLLVDERRLQRMSRASLARSRMLFDTRDLALRSMEAYVSHPSDQGGRS
jgi:glycosyltransferase involved in cell wall biosynthesis